MRERAPRVPVQARARRRRDALLDAATRILEREGIGGLTTNAVAKEAATSIGALYEYFANKDAIVAALLERFRERLRAVLEAQAAELTTGASMEEVTSEIVEAFYLFYRDEPGYHALWLGVQASPLVERAGLAWADEFTRWIEDLLAARSPSLDKRSRRAVASTAVYLTSGLLTAALTRPRRQQRPLVEETKLALAAYLAARL